MTDREKLENVIKGLECCAHEEIGDCDNCSYNENTPHCDIAMMRDAIALLKAQEPVEPDIEGNVEYDGHGSWWHVCGACRQPIDKGDKFCRWCGKAVKWE